MQRSWGMHGEEAHGDAAGPVGFASEVDEGPGRVLSRDG